MNAGDMEGQVIGQYRVTGILGEGGMGVVYAAEHTLLGRPAAVKVLLPELSRKQEVVTRFFNEARSATAIRHPGIVEIYDFGWMPDGAAFIVMERLEGETLRSRRGRAHLPWSTALALTRQIAGALGAAHAKGIVHRDLKPDNIFLVPDPEVPGGERIKLLDFGIAKLAGSSSGQHKTRTGAVMGTPTYMAPEQCRGVNVDSRADVYSLGCILFELCAGRPPFVGEGEGDVLAAHIYVAPPTIASLTRGIPQEIEALVQRMLAKSPLERVQTADEVIRLVDAATAAVGVTTPRSSGAGMITSGVIGAPPVQAKHVDTSAQARHVDTTTLSSAVSTHLLESSRTSRRRGVVIGSTLGVLVLSGVIALVVASGGDDVPTTTATAVAIPDVHGDAEPAPPPPTEPPAPIAPSPPRPADPVTSPAGTAPSQSATTAPPAEPKPEPKPEPKSEPPATPPPSLTSPTRPSPTRPTSPTGSALSSTKPSVARPPADPTPVPATPSKPTTIEVSIDSVPSGAKLLRDGNMLGVTPYRSTLSRADRDIKFVLQLRGHRDQSITVRPNAAIKQSVKLEPVPPPPKPIPPKPTPPKPTPPKPHDRAVNPFD